MSGEIEWHILTQNATGWNNLDTFFRPLAYDIRITDRNEIRILNLA